jgi:hypothetical protein
MEQISPRKLAANRKNALESTGPRTPEGKEKSRWNALEHGLLAQEAVIPYGPAQEDDAEMEHLLVALRDDLQPCGALEEILVEQIAVCYWRLRRVLRAENGEIRRDTDDAPRSFRLQLTTQAMLASEKGMEQPSQLRANTYGINALLAYLEHLETEVAANKALSNASLRKIEKYFSGGPDGLAARCALAQSDSSTNTAENLLRLLEVEKTKLTKALPEVRGNELERLQSDFDRLSLPKAAEKIVRYETAIERQLNRALYHLEKVQERRRDRKEMASSIFTKRTQTSTSGPSTAAPESPPASAPGPAAAGSG